MLLVLPCKIRKERIAAALHAAPLCPMLTGVPEGASTSLQAVASTSYLLSTGRFDEVIRRRCQRPASCVNYSNASLRRHLSRCSVKEREAFKNRFN